MSNIFDLASGLASFLSALLIIFFFIPTFKEKKIRAQELNDQVKERKEEEEAQHFLELYEKCIEPRNEEFRTLIANLDIRVMEEIAAMRQEISDANQQQDETLKILCESVNNIMRTEMNRIYQKYKPYKQIYLYDFKAAQKIYNDYHNGGGNYYIDDIWDEILTWEQTEEKICD